MEAGRKEKEAKSGEGEHEEFVLSSGGVPGVGGGGKLGDARGSGRVHGLGAGAVALRKVRPVHVHAAPASFVRAKINFHES